MFFLTYPSNRDSRASLYFGKLCYGIPYSRSVVITCMLCTFVRHHIHTQSMLVIYPPAFSGSMCLASQRSGVNRHSWDTARHSQPLLRFFHNCHRSCCACTCYLSSRRPRMEVLGYSHWIRHLAHHTEPCPTITLTPSFVLRASWAGLLLANGH